MEIYNKEIQNQLLQKPTLSQPEESTDMVLNRLISVQGIKQKQGRGLLFGTKSHSKTSL